VRPFFVEVGRVYARFLIANARALASCVKLARLSAPAIATSWTLRSNRPAPTPSSAKHSVCQV